MQLFIAFDWECGFAIQPKAIGCFPVMALQAVSHDWMADVCTCVDFLREELSWRDAMDRLLYQMTHEFEPDFKEFIPIYLERYICQMRNAYFAGCFGCIRIRFTLGFQFEFDLLCEWKESLSTLHMGWAVSCVMIDILYCFCCQGLTTSSPTSRRTSMVHLSDLPRRLEIWHCCCCETNFRLEMHLYNYCMNGANLAIAFESLM